MPQNVFQILCPYVLCFIVHPTMKDATHDNLTGPMMCGPDDNDLLSPIMVIHETLGKKVLVSRRSMSENATGEMF